MEISEEQKELLTWNKKHLSLFIKGFHWSKATFMEVESPTLRLSATPECGDR